MEREPFGSPERDLRHGTLLAAVLAPHMKKGARADPRQYMFHPPEEREMTPEETVAFFKAALGG